MNQDKSNILNKIKAGFLRRVTLSVKALPGLFVEIVYLLCLLLTAAFILFFWLKLKLLF